MNQSPLLTIENLTIAIDATNKPVVDHLNFSIYKGQCLGLVGESGSGKSLTALSIIQLLPQKARISLNSQNILNGKNLLDYSEHQMRQVRGKIIGTIFQDAMSAFNPVLTIGQQLIEVIRLHQGFSFRSAQKRALTLLTEVGIDDEDRCLHSYPHQLSGGMRQRAMIAMALCGNPELLIADEPTTALDVTIQKQILMLLRQLTKNRQMTILFISHDLGIVGQLADEIVVLRKGLKVEQASRDIFFHHPQNNYSKKLLNAILAPIARKCPLSSENTLLRVENLKVYFPIKKGVFHRTQGYIKSVDDISFEILSGETFALIGESGCGKTTTAKAIIRLIKITNGHVIFSGTDLAYLSNSALRQQRADLQIIFQDPYSSLNPRMLIVDSLLEGIFAQNKAVSRRAGLAIIDKLLAQVELSYYSVKWRYPHEFSGGERQRLCLARALALKPKLLILDEPTSSLDVSIQKQMLALLEKLQNEMGLSYLLITHDLGVVAYLAHRMAVMQHGKIVESGPTAEILKNPRHDYTKKLLSNVI